MEPTFKLPPPQPITWPLAVLLADVKEPHGELPGWHLLIGDGAGQMFWLDAAMDAYSFERLEPGDKNVFKGHVTRTRPGELWGWHDAWYTYIAPAPTVMMLPDDPDLLDPQGYLPERETITIKAIRLDARRIIKVGYGPKSKLWVIDPMVDSRRHVSPALDSAKELDRWK